MDPLSELRVLALDCQAAGATPAHGDLLELGWAVCSATGIVGSVRSNWIAPRTERPVPRAVRELTGWTPACVADAVSEQQAWAALRDDIAPLSAGGSAGSVPTVIHFARFELPFLRDLHERLGEKREFPCDPICLHAVAARLFPDLPRRNIRALAGYLGHSPELLRRSAGHVTATAFIWSAVVPLLDEAGVRTWSELRSWLEQSPPSVRRKRRVFPLARERRQSLPDQPGVYRFLRRNGDVLYVGKAVSLKKRVASHFNGGSRMSERALEFLTQVHDVRHTETPSLLEAALLESDEIKRIDPPYNVQLRASGRSAWFASRDFRQTSALPDDAHCIGPLPSERALLGLWALISLADRADSRGLRAAALAVPTAYLPDDALFDEGFQAFTAEHFQLREASASRRVQSASRALWLARRRAEPEAAAEEHAPDAWDLLRVRRRLERSLLNGGLLVRRARWLCSLSEATIAFRERNGGRIRALVVADASIASQCDLASMSDIYELTPRKPRALRERQLAFDAMAYDRLRVLSTELQRVREEGGEIIVRIGLHSLADSRLSDLMRLV